MSMPGRPVVVGVDGSPAALRAVAWAAREADRRELTVHLVAAIPAGTDPSSAALRAHGDLTAARRAALASAAVETSTEVAVGEPGAVLVARGRDASLVVLGCADGDVPRAPSPAPAVIAGAAVPVVVVPSRWETDRHVGEVAVAVDPSEPDALRHVATAVAADIARRWHRPLLVVVALPGAHTAPDVGAARRVFDAGKQDAGADVVVHEVLAHGDPAEELLGLVGPATGLLVLGASGPGGEDSDAVGSTVLRRARCPVMVVTAAVPPPLAARAAAAAGRPA